MATLTEEEIRKFQALFGELGIEAEVTSTEDVKDWITSNAKPKQEANTEEEPTNNKDDKETGRKEDKPEHQACYLEKPSDRRPRVSTFWGTSTQKDATPYEVWRYEVECYLSDTSHSEEAILEAIRRSLKGDAAKVSMRLGPKAEVRDIIEKFDGLYGTVATEGTLLSQFYSAQQNQDEDVTSWSCRLEDTIQKVYERGLLDRTTTREMLRSKLWSGLRNETLKNATRHKYDLIKNYDELVIEIRSVEQELGLLTPKKTVKSQFVQKTASEKDDRSEATLKSISERLARLEKEMADVKSQVMAGRTSPWRGRYTYQRRNGRGRAGETRQQEESMSVNNEFSDQKKNEKGAEFVCFKCGQEGHIALGCRVRTDHLRNLNATSPMQRGKHLARRGAPHQP